MNKEFISEGCINEPQQLLTDSNCIWRDVWNAIAMRETKLFSAKISTNFSSIPPVLLFGSLNSILSTNQNNVEAAHNGDHREKEILTGTR